METPDGNLAKGMRQLNDVCTQRFNQAHARVGHVYQGRYKAILVQKEASGVTKVTGSSGLVPCVVG